MFETSSTRIRSTLHSWLLQAPELREPTSADYKIVWRLELGEKKVENLGQMGAQELETSVSREGH